MPSVLYAECHYAECFYAECRDAVCKISAHLSGALYDEWELEKCAVPFFKINGNDILEVSVSPFECKVLSMKLN